MGLPGLTQGAFYMQFASKRIWRRRRPGVVSRTVTDERLSKRFLQAARAC